MVIESDALILLADEQKFFAANGLNVTIKKYDTGLAATDAMIKGEVDISKATEFVLVQKAFEKANISAITTYYESLGAVIVGRKDLRIENVSDLLGKRIGVARGAIPEFYLGRFLNLNGINIKNVTIVDMKPPLMISDLFAGNIDAICLADSYLYQLEHQQMDRLVVWPAQSGQLTYGGLVANNNWMVLHPELIKRFLKALLQAEDYAIRNPTAAKTLTQKRLGYDDAYMAVVWPDSQFSLSLDQSFITAMEDEARWMIANNLTAEKQVPNFNDYVNEDALKALKPESGNIIR